VHDHGAHDLHDDEHGHHGEVMEAPHPLPDEI